MGMKCAKRLVRLFIAGLLLSGCRSAALPSPTPVPIPTSVPPSPTAVPTTPGLVLYYPFNGDANDMSGNGNNGQVHGATLTADRFGIPNRAYAFDGVAASISFDASKMPVGTSPRTISAWIKAESYPPEAIPGVGSRATVVGWGLDESRQLSEMQVVNGRLVFHCYGIEPPGSTPLELNQWYHLAIVYNEGPVCLYVNGVQNKCQDVPIDTAAGVGRIGAFPDAKTHGFDGSYFHGTIDDIRVCNSALSAAQIQQLYTEGGWGK